MLRASRSLERSRHGRARARPRRRRTRQQPDRLRRTVPLARAASLAGRARLSTRGAICAPPAPRLWESRILLPSAPGTPSASSCHPPAPYVRPRAPYVARR
eukprot:2759078-Pyramimonas_sp.AAC.1